MENQINNTFVRKNIDKAFENAEKQGYKDIYDDYMYMYSKGNIDYFKHIDTREYIEVLNYE